MAKITIEFIGTGSAFSQEYGNTSAVVTVDNNGLVKRLLIDCGRTAPDDLYTAGYRWTDIDSIFITHLHGDHIYGLEHAGFMSRYIYNKKPHLIFPHDKMKNDLWEKVLKGTMMQGDLDRQMHFDDYFDHESISRNDAYFMFNDVMFSVYPTFHIPNKKSYGLIIGEYDFVIYTADSLFEKEFLQMSIKEGCQAVFHDCQFKHYEGRVHTSLVDLLTLEQDERKMVYIMHYGDDLPEYAEIIEDSGFRVSERFKKYQFEVQ